jgi:nitrate reductase delta subunit
MSHLPRVCAALSRLLSYPDSHTVQNAELLYVVLQSELPEAARRIAAFGTYAEHHDLSELEEIYTSTFDINPACALEVGWHLFGEEYSRGLFLVRMREELRKFNLPESTELTDHLTHVLAVVASMSEEQAGRFVKACVQPAVEKMRLALSEKDSPYGDVIDCLAIVLRYTWGDPQIMQPTESGGKTPFGGDLLRDYPAANVMAGCLSPYGEPLDLVTLDLTRPECRDSSEQPSRESLPIITEPL